MKRSVFSRLLWCGAGLSLVLVAALIVCLSPAALSTFFATASGVVAAIMGEGSVLIGYTPLLLKLLFFGCLALTVWGCLFSEGVAPLKTLLCGVAVTLFAAGGVELLQSANPLRTAVWSDFLLSTGIGVLTAGGLFLGEWGAQTFPKLLNRETILYVVFGGVTTVVNIVVFQLCYNLLGIHELIANTLAWIAAVLVAYITNKLWVFESHTKTVAAFLQEIGLFFGARLLSFGVDQLGIWLMVSVLSFHSGLAKIITNIIVLIMNYLFSKWFIFKKDKA